MHTSNCWYLHFNWAYSASYPNLNKKNSRQIRIETFQNICIRFWQQLDKMTHIDDKEFETLNWLPMTERFIQCIISIVFKYVNDKYSYYINEVFQTGPENNNQTR